MAEAFLPEEESLSVVLVKGGIACDLAGARQGAKSKYSFRAPGSGRALAWFC